MLSTPIAGLLPSARLLLPRAIRETGAGAWNVPPCDATGEGSAWGSPTDTSVPAEVHSKLYGRLTGGLGTSRLSSGYAKTAAHGHL
jgi:hypothetical protein